MLIENAFVQAWCSELWTAMDNRNDADKFKNEGIA
jgi:hypothetical protein